MEKKFEKATIGEKISDYMESRIVVLVSILAVAVVAIAAYCVAVAVISKSNEKGLSDIDTISYTLTRNTASLSDEELDKRRAHAMGALEPLLLKNGVVGVRANMLAAEIAYSEKEYAEAADFWTAAAKKGRKSYTNPIVFFNAGVCYENIGDLDKAESCYAQAAGNAEFLMASHAEFSLGRVREEKGDSAGAVSAYQRLFDREPDSSWGRLSKTRLIALSSAASGGAE